MNQTQTKMLQTEIPLALLVQVEDWVNQGCFRSIDDVILDALRQYLESSRTDLMVAFVRQDNERGLTGNTARSNTQ
jgi:Arc/MetJ-type ribon-helix-helix transcriptional regulator